MPTLQIADKPTLDEINNKIDDMASIIVDKESLDNINGNIKNIQLQVQSTLNNVSSIQNTLKGEVTPYGTGVLGDVVYDPNAFLWGAPDILNRYILHCKSFVLPEGVTMIPPVECDGVYIFSQGDIVINGTIDVTGKRKTKSASHKIADTITVDGTIYALAKGGDTKNGGAGGASGNATKPYNVSGAAGGTPTTAIPGSIIGGGCGYYGTGATAPECSEHSNSSQEFNTSAKAGSVVLGAPAPCAVILIAAGNITIGSSGKINGLGTDGAQATNGKNAVGSGYYSNDYNGNRFAVWYGRGGAGGDGTIPPSGGAPITIICNHFINNGIIDTKGRVVYANTTTKGTDVSKSVSLEPNEGSSYTRSITCSGTGGIGGQGVTVISLPGEIKVYERNNA